MFEYNLEMANRLTDIYCEVLEDYDWVYTRRAVEKIVNTAIERKQGLIELLRNHPKWDEENLMIQFDKTIGREPDVYSAHLFWGEFIRWNERTFHGYMFTKNDYLTFLNIGRLSDVLFNGTEQLLNAREIDEGNSILKNIPQLQRIRLNAGQKRSKAVSKICIALGFNRMPEYERKYALYANAVNPLEITRHTCISVNPIDFLLSSNGNSWSSCHNIDKETYSGCNCSGGISYSLDDVTICMYTVDASYEGNEIFREKKINRMLLHVSHDLKHFVAARCYPDGSYNCGDRFREIFEKAFSECSDIPNLWVKSKENLSDYAYVADEATAYPDIDYAGSNHIVHVFHKSVEENKDSLTEIKIGAAPICVECGYEHSIKDQINCCHSFEGGKQCDNCGAEISEDDEVYSEYYGTYGCTDCMRYCEYADGWFYNDDFEYVENYGYVNIYSLENSGDFFYCYKCERWHWIDNMAEVDTPEGTMCMECAEERGYRECAWCGEWEEESEMFMDNNGEWFCENCKEHGDFDNDSTNETEVA